MIFSGGRIESNLPRGWAAPVGRQGGQPLPAARPGPWLEILRRRDRNQGGLAQFGQSTGLSRRESRVRVS